jgi:hypothetical protein
MQLAGDTIASANRSETYTRMVYVWGPVALIAFGVIIAVTGVVWLCR